MKKALLATCVVALGSLGLAPLGLTPAGADPIGSGSARGFGAQVQLTGQDVIPPSAEASVVAPPFGDDSVETLVPIEADPVAVSLTANGIARVHEASDIVSELEVATQAVEGPYNAQGLGSVEDLNVLLDVAGDDVSLVEADVLRGEAVAVCTGGTVQYSANSEVVNLVIGGSDVPLNGPLSDLLDEIAAALAPLADLITIDQNVVTELDGGGIAVDALVITVLGAIGEDPLATIVVGHAEVGAVSCAVQTNPGQVVKDGPQTVEAGQSFDYKITVTNIGVTCDLTAVKVTDTIHGPAGSQVTATSPPADSVTGTPESTGGIVLVWNDIGPIAAGQSKVLTVTIKTPTNAADGSKYTDDARAEYLCGETPFTDTDRIERPEVEAPLARTGVDGAAYLLAGSILASVALAGIALRRRGALV